MSVDRSHWRLRRRVFGSILVAGSVLAPFVLVGMWAVVTTVEDTILKRLVRIEADRLIAAQQAGFEVQESPLFTAFWGFDQLPEPFRSTSGEASFGIYRPLDALEPGIYEVRGLEAFVAIGAQKHGPLILFYDVSTLEPLQELEPIFWGVASTMFALAIFAGALFVFRRTRFGLDLRTVIQDRDMAEALGTKRPYTNLKTYLEYKKRGIATLQAHAKAIAKLQSGKAADAAEISKLVIEALARSLKNELRMRMREKMRQLRVPLLAPYRQYNSGNTSIYPGTRNIYRDAYTQRLVLRPHALNRYPDGTFRFLSAGIPAQSGSRDRYI
ncbi:MAG: hypothetical protein HC793_04810, partial [Aquincola sp.]|nr:hypothetical protein [Aquincola sp.]